MKPHPHCRVTLIRHGEVDAAYRRICYGRMDVPLSDHGRATSEQLALQIADADPPDRVIHSGLERTRFLAEAITDAAGIPAPELEPRLLERDYGDWQGQTWDDVFASDPDHFHDLIEKPDRYRPPSGETTLEMQHRIVSWYADLADKEATARRERTQGLATRGGNRLHVLAVSHSGPVTALAGAILNLHPRDWTDWMPPTLGALDIGALDIDAEDHASACRWASWSENGQTGTEPKESE